MVAQETHLSRSPTALDRAAIIKAYVGELGPSENVRELEEEYFLYYCQQLDSLRFRYGRIGIWEFPLTSHSQMLEIIYILREAAKETTKCQLRDRLREKPYLQSQSDGKIDSVIDAGLRFWLMINFRSPGDHIYDSGRFYVTWQAHLTLCQQLNILFEKSAMESILHQRRLSPRFSVATMNEICDLEISWTSCLADHLRLDRQRKVLQVFTNRHFLLGASKASKLYSLGTSHDVSTKLPFPDGFLQETNRTLDLLFPSTDRRTRKFLRGKGKHFHMIEPQQASRDLRDFPYWKDRILELYEDVFLGDPEGWRQLWRDRRDLQKFWTFWIALAIFLMTVISTIASIVQTWAALKALEGL